MTEMKKYSQLDDTIPEKLYRFRSLSANSLSAIQDQQFWFSTIDHFNDPHEFLFSLDTKMFDWISEGCKAPEEIAKAIELFGSFVSEEEIKQAADSGTLSKTLRAGAYALIRKNIQKFGVCCWFENLANILFWSHYADSHRGFCVEIETSKIELHTLAKVNYVDAPPIIDIWGNDEDFERNKRIVLTKGQSWQYEGEWRFIKHQGNQLFSIGSNAVSAVYFGWRMSGEHKSLIRNVTKDSCQYYDSILDPETYEIDFVESGFRTLNDGLLP